MIDSHLPLLGLKLLHDVLVVIELFEVEEVRDVFLDSLSVFSQLEHPKYTKQSVVSLKIK